MKNCIEIRRDRIEFRVIFETNRFDFETHEFFL